MAFHYMLKLVTNYILKYKVLLMYKKNKTYEVPFLYWHPNLGILTAQLSIFRKQEHVPSFHFIENNLSHDLQKLVPDNLKTGLRYL